MEKHGNTFFDEEGHKILIHRSKYGMPDVIWTHP